MIAGGAGVTVVACSGYCNVVALPVSEANVLGAEVVVAAILHFPRVAESAFAVVSA